MILGGHTKIWIYELCVSFISFFRWSFLPNKYSLLKPFDFFQSTNFLLCREKYDFAATTMDVLKIFEKHLWRSFLSWRLGIYNFTKNEVIHWASLWILVAPSAGNFPECNFQVGSFDKHLLCHQHYFGMSYPPPIFKSTLPHYALPIH